MAIEVPLFPLGTVLFPHMPMSLHIFEERYKTMMRDCREASTTFGIVAIRSGQETGGGAVPYEVGTLAQLDEIEELPGRRVQPRGRGSIALSHRCAPPQPAVSRRIGPLPPGRPGPGGRHRTPRTQR